MYRLSSYTIFIPINGNISRSHIVMHGYTGAVDFISSKLYETLMQDNMINQSFIEEADFKALLKRGYVVDVDKEEELKRLEHVAKSYDEYLYKLKSSLTILPSYQCDFACPYCFEKEVIHEQKSVEVMDENIVNSIINYVDKREKSNDPLYSICFYGGEPFLPIHKSPIEKIVNKASEKGIKLIAVTNGYNLKLYRSLLGADKISTVQITIDGSKKTHNARRCLKDGKPTFDTIMENIELCLACGVKVSVRTNIDSQNLEEISQIVEEYDKRGFTQSSNFKFYFKGVFDCYDNCGVQTVSDYEVFKYMKKNGYQNYYLNIPTFNEIFSGIIKVFKKNGFMPIKPSFCGSSYGMICIDNKADIYACWELVGKKNYSIGQLNEQGEIDYIASDNNWVNRKVYSQKRCRYCKYALFCGGNCPSHELAIGQDINHAKCNSFAKIFNEAIQFAYDVTYNSIAEVNKK